MSARLGIASLLAPVAIFVALNAVGGAAAYLSSPSRLPFVAGIHHCLPPAFARIHPRYRTPWVAIGIYGLAGIAVTLLGQAGTSVRGAYEVLVSMGIISYFVPYLFLFAAMIRMQSTPAGPEVRRVPGGRPVAIALASLGLASTAMTIVPNKPLAIAKVVGGTVVLIAAGIAVFLFSRWKTRRSASEALTL
jgi:amino acid transporter